MILYIDAQPLLVSPLRDFMADETGQEVVMAQTVERALQIITERSGEINLIFSGVVMARPQAILPDVEDVDGLNTGLSLTRKIKEQWPDKEVWLLTTRHNLTDEDLVYARVPRQRYYINPIRNLDQFVRELQEFLQQQT